jgi:hypothetical protein
MHIVTRFYRTTEEARPGMETFAHSLACSERDLECVCTITFNRRLYVTPVSSCLRKKPFDEIIKVQFLGYVHFLEDGYDNFLPWLPLVAPELHGGLPSNPLDAFRSGKFHRVPFIIGSVMNETDAWIPKFVNDSIEVNKFANILLLLSCTHVLFTIFIPSGRDRHAHLLWFQCNRYSRAIPREPTVCSLRDFAIGFPRDMLCSSCRTPNFKHQPWKCACVYKHAPCLHSSRSDKL